MRPVYNDEAGSLVYWRPLILLDKTLRGPAYVESLVSQCPTLISTNIAGRKTLPLEVWYIILDFVTNDPDPHAFALIRAQYLQTDCINNKTLVCTKINQWRSFGSLQSRRSIVAANKYLARPDLVFDDLDSPFGDIQESSRAWEIPTRIFSSTIKALHVGITVPDIIKYLESGT
ncbi:hypothetical protein ACLX1H_000600 [Fusarium chlamydosporum]